MVYELIKGISGGIAIVLSISASAAYLNRKQYHEAWWYLALTAIIVFVTQS